jgi:hypothetical protein
MYVFPSLLHVHDREVVMVPAMCLVSLQASVAEVLAVLDVGNTVMQDSLGTYSITQKTTATKRVAKKGPAMKGVVMKEAAKKGVAKKGVAKKDVAKKGAAKKGVAKKGAAKKGTVTKGAAMKGAAVKGAAKKGAAVKGAAKKGATNHTKRKRADDRDDEDNTDEDEGDTTVEPEEEEEEDEVEDRDEDEDEDDGGCLGGSQKEEFEYPSPAKRAKTTNDSMVEMPTGQAASSDEGASTQLPAFVQLFCILHFLLTLPHVTLRAAHSGRIWDASLMAKALPPKKYNRFKAALCKTDVSTMWLINTLPDWFPNGVPHELLLRAIASRLGALSAVWDTESDSVIVRFTAERPFMKAVKAARSIPLYLAYEL